MTEMTRAERRRAAREKEWVGFTPDNNTTLSKVNNQLQRHTLSCNRCSNKTANGGKQCDWMLRFYYKNQLAMNALLGIEPDPQELDLNVGEEA